MIKTSILALGVALTANAALGQTFLSTNGTTLFRTTVSGMSVVTDTFTLSADITSLAVNPNTGEIYGSAFTDANGNGTRELYRLNNPFGTPNLTLVGDFLAENTPTLSFVGSRLLGAQQSPGGMDLGVLIEIDLNTLTQATIDPNIGQRFQSSGYDAATDTLYGGTPGNTVTSELFTIPYADMDVEAVLVGPTTQGTITSGGEFFNGVLYQATNTFGVGQVIGTLDTATGAFTALFTLDNGGNALPVGLAVIPAPGVASAFAMLGIAGIRRRR